MLVAPTLISPDTMTPVMTRRQYAHGELMLAAFVSSRRPLSFLDLLDVMANSGASISDVLEWLSGAHASGLLDETGYETGVHGEMIGPRRYSLSAEARRALRRSRRSTAVRRAPVALAV